MSVVRNSFLQQMRAGGSAMLTDVQWVTDPLVHAVRQPVSGIIQDAHDVSNAMWGSSGPVLRLGAYWIGGWLAWTAFGDVFPNEKRALVSVVDRAWKRARWE